MGIEDRTSSSTKLLQSEIWLGFQIFSFKIFETFFTKPSSVFFFFKKRGETPPLKRNESLLKIKPPNKRLNETKIRRTKKFRKQKYGISLSLSFKNGHISKLKQKREDPFYLKKKKSEQTMEEPLLKPLFLLQI